MRISKETIAILLLTWSVVSVVGVLRIASVIALSSDLAAPSTAMRDGELFWQEKINDRGGVLINGTRRLVEIISVDVGASTYEEVLQKVTDTAYRISNGTYGEIHAVFTPYTSVLTEAFMLVAEKSKIFSCSSSASSPFVFACDQENREPCTKGRGRRFAYLVGLQASTATVFPPVISLVNIKGAESIGVFREVGTNDLFFIAEKDGAINAAEDNSMEVVLDTTVLSATEATSEETRNNYLQLISQLQIAKPDVVVGAVLEQGCQAFVMAAKELNYTADAWILSVCLNPDEYRQVVGEDGLFWGVRDQG